MEQRLDFYKASPEAIKALVALEVAIGKRGLDPMLVNLVSCGPRRSTAAPTASTRTVATRARRARPSAAFTQWPRGASRRSSPTANAPR